MIKLSYPDYWNYCFFSVEIPRINWNFSVGFFPPAEIFAIFFVWQNIYYIVLLWPFPQSSSVKELLVPCL